MLVVVFREEFINVEVDVFIPGIDGVVMVVLESINDVFGGLIVIIVCW